MQLRVASYNIHAGAGTDRRFQPHRLARVLRHMEADIIGLQEVVSVGPDGFALLDELARGCNMRAIAGPTMMRRDARYGNALLTRLPLGAVQHLSLDVAHYEPRGALSVAVETAGGPLTVAVTHLGLRARERRQQITRLLEWLPPASTPSVLLADLNEWWPWSANLRMLRRRFARMPAYPTFPARFPVLALDRILLSAAVKLHRIRPLREAGRHKASDHRALIADIEIAG